MPYTPPTQRSPASSKTNSPILSRNHSYSDPSPGQSLKNATTKPSSPRPALPRSVSSTSYLNKHRRSPSIPNQHSTSNGIVVNGQGTYTVSRRGPSANGSLRQSPPPVNDYLIPSGAVSTPPDSSDDENERGRKSAEIEKLTEALKHIDVQRGQSPNRDDVPDARKTITIITRPGALTESARKISHSRSASEITLSQHAPGLDIAPVISSTEGSDAEDELRIKPPLLRKKSGELVKPALRPSSSRRRPSSMPGTPTYSKAVHFNEDMEQVRTFLSLDRPMAVSAGSSPVETYDDDSEYPFNYEDSYRARGVEWEIKVANFPGDTYERQTAPVRVERIFLSSDNKTLVGTVAVANIDFQKLVVARFTLDYWKTTSEVVAEYNHDVRKKQSNDGYDRFNFNIKLADQANLESKTLLLCVRYNVKGQEFWDNNNSMNYQVDFTKKTKSKEKKSSGPLGAIPRSRRSPTVPRPRSMPVGNTLDDDFSNAVDSKYSFGGLGDSPNTTIRFKPKSKRGPLFPDQAVRNSSGHVFSARYDFGASLSAALTNAQTAGDRKVALVSKPEKEPSVEIKKPDLQSAEYNELIQKFCFFGTPGKLSPPQANTPVAKTTNGTDGSADYMQNSSSSDSNRSSISSTSSSSPAMVQLFDGANDTFHLIPRSASSPGKGTGSGPMSSGYHQYEFGRHGNMFPPEAGHTPQACM